MISKIYSALIFNLICCIFCVHANTQCLPRETQYGLVCVCTASYCDYLENPEPAADEVVVISTSKDGQRFAVSNLHFGLNSSQETIVDELKFLQSLIGEKDRLSYTLFLNTSINLKVNRSMEYQKITGFGGAITGSVSYLLDVLDERLQDHIYKSFFHKDGIGFTMLRTPIGGCDFDLEPWAYNEEPQNDVELSNFTQLDPRDELKVKQIKRLKLVSELEDLKIMAAAWSPPVWMKSNDDWMGTSKLKTKYYQTWADYHLRYIELMTAHNTSIWAISTGNQPLSGITEPFLSDFMTLGWLPYAQAIWVNDFFGPTIRNSKYKDVLIFGNDGQRISYATWFNMMEQSRPGVLDYLDGLAVHWYTDDLVSPLIMDVAVEQLPGKTLLNTESCIKGSPEIGSWERGEKYARSFLTNLQHSYNGWIDFNLILDEQGGPNYANNFVDAPILVNATNFIEIYKQPIFYATAHFTKFVPEGSVRIEADVVQVFGNSTEAIAFKRPDERIAVVVLNSADHAVDIRLNDSVNGEIKIKIPANSWHTIIYN